MASRLSNGNVCSVVVEAESTAKSSEHEMVAAAQSVDEEEEPDDGYGGFDNTKDSGGEETGIRSSYADRFEDGGGVVVDCVDAGGVLPEEEGAAEEEAVCYFAVIPEGLEWLLLGKSVVA